MTESKPPKELLDRVPDALWLKYYWIHTEESYLNWIQRYILLHYKRHPQDMGGPEIEALVYAPTGQRC